MADERNTWAREMSDTQRSLQDKLHQEKSLYMNEVRELKAQIQAANEAHQVYARTARALTGNQKSSATRMLVQTLQRRMKGELGYRLTLWHQGTVDNKTSAQLLAMQHRLEQSIVSSEHERKNLLADNEDLIRAEKRVVSNDLQKHWQNTLAEAEAKLKQQISDERAAWLSEKEALLAKHAAEKEHLQNQYNASKDKMAAEILELQAGYSNQLGALRHKEKSQKQSAAMNQLKQIFTRAIKGEAAYRVVLWCQNLQRWREQENVSNKEKEKAKVVNDNRQLWAAELSSVSLTLIQQIAN